MTPEECARFILSDCQDPILRAKADAENTAEHERLLREVPAYKRAWDANIQHMADEIDARCVREFCGESTDTETE